MSMSDTVQNGAATDALDNKKDEIDRKSVV